MVADVIPQPVLDPQSEVPLYRQLHHYYTDLIRSGTLAQGERLPATRELAGLLGLNRTTISAAYELLESEGLIAGQVGRGSFVTGRSRSPRSRLDWRSLLAPGLLARRGASSGYQELHQLRRVAARRSSFSPWTISARSCEEVHRQRRDLASILQLGSPGGYAPLRQYLIAEGAAPGRRWARPTTSSITSGCQQALDLLQRVLVRPATKSLLEDPVYPGREESVCRRPARS